LVAAQDATPAARDDAGSSGPAVRDAVPFLGTDGQEAGRVTVSAVADPWQDYDADNAPERGSHYVLVTVTVENTSPRPLPVEAGHFFLLDAEGFVFRLPAMGLYRGEAEEAAPDVPAIQELTPGEQLSGILEFVVPDGAADLARVVFTPTPGLQGPDRLVYAAELPRAGSVPPAVGDGVSVVGPDGEETARVTVSEAIDPFQEYDPDSAPDTGSRYVVLNVTVENTGPRPLSLSVGDFLVRDTDGFLYRPNFFSRGPSEEDEPDLGVLELPPGEQASGFVEFMLPAVGDPREFLWWPETNRLILVADLGLAGPTATAVPSGD
jgi:hypothetical protein